MRAQSKSVAELTDLQKQIVEAIWTRGRASVREVRAHLEAGGKPLAHTSVLTLMQRLEKAGWLRHRTVGRTFVYQPAFSREQATRHSFRRLIDRLFGGRPALLVQHLMAEEEFSEEELLAIRRILDEKKRSGKQ